MYGVVGIIFISTIVPSSNFSAFPVTSSDACSHALIDGYSGPANQSLMRCNNSSESELSLVIQSAISPADGLARKICVYVVTKYLVVLVYAEEPIAVLSYDEWGGTRSIPELLAAFSLPNNPHVDRILSEAGALLAKGRQSYLLNGYDSKSRESVWAQISAVYSAIAARDLK